MTSCPYCGGNTRLCGGRTAWCPVEKTTDKPPLSQEASVVVEPPPLPPVKNKQWIGAGYHKVAHRWYITLMGRTIWIGSRR